MQTRQRLRQGFTLIELVLVVAILVVISALAIPKLAGYKLDAAKKMNVSNLSRVGHYLETFLAANDNEGLNRLDSLFFVNDFLPVSTNDLDGDFPRLLATADSTNGVVLHSVLCSSTPVYGTTAPALLGTYALSEADAKALNDIGLKYVMCGTDGGRYTTGDDSVWAQGSALDPLEASCVAKFLTNGCPVACINPGAVSGADATIAPIGALVYESCGEDVHFWFSGRSWGPLVGETKCTSGEEAFNLLNEPGADGILLAFGIGQFASCIGNNKAGFDSAPVCPLVNSKDPSNPEYSRYIALVRLRRTAFGVTAEYAGVMDPTGQTIGQARKSIQ